MPIVNNRVTCITTPVGTVLGTGLFLLISCFACKDVACMFGMIGCLGGCTGGAVGGTWWTKKQNQNLQEEQTNLNNQLATAQTPLLRQLRR
jgi:hypothetical protein